MTVGNCPIEAGEEFAFNFEYLISADAPIPIVSVLLIFVRKMYLITSFTISNRVDLMEN